MLGTASGFRFRRNREGVEVKLPPESFFRPLDTAEGWIQLWLEQEGWSASTAMVRSAIDLVVTAHGVTSLQPSDVVALRPWSFVQRVKSEALWCIWPDAPGADLVADLARRDGLLRADSGRHQYSIRVPGRGKVRVYAVRATPAILAAYHETPPLDAAGGSTTAAEGRGRVV